MPDDRRFLLGYGERLAQEIPDVGRGGPKKHPYTFQAARDRLAPRIADVASVLETMPDAACPADQAVAALTLHPAYLAKSYFPDELLSAIGLRAVGSRARKVTPEKWQIVSPPESAITAEIFVAGPRSRFRQWAQEVEQWSEYSRGATELREIEDFRVISPQDRVRPLRTDAPSPLLEVVLHADERSEFVVGRFREYIKSLKAVVNLNQRMYAQGLCFLPVRIRREMISKLAAFSFLRAAREMPSLRVIHPLLRRVPTPPRFQCQVPHEGPIDPTLRVAVFDGGMPRAPDLSAWVKKRKTRGVGVSAPALVNHGLAVTSAVLFGPIENGRPLGRPYAAVDHFRVLDAATAQDPQGEYFPIVRRIRDVIQTRRPSFVVISIGPDLPMEDDDVHVWTAVLDQLLADGRTLAAIAVGNDGEKDWASGNARIQSPADCVNAITIGAADNLGSTWRRASYSSIGPGRSPGVVKPDILAFGGSKTTPFNVLAKGAGNQVREEMGTSFAAPFALRSALAVRAHLGPVVGPLALKVLLIHRADRASVHDRREAGWGRVPTGIDQLITCARDEVHVVYQGELAPKQWIRLPIPVPPGELKGIVEINATFCFATETDPQDTISYTRAGLEVVFRPNKTARRDPRQKNANSEAFFRARDYYLSSDPLRADAHKWETTIHASKRKQGIKLSDPVFDVHHHARERGAAASSPDNIRYALVVSVRAPQIPTLYDEVVRRYRNQLEILRPVIEIPIPISVRRP